MLKLAVIGDLHYEPADSREFDVYFEQINRQHPNVICQLGDIGGYSYSGSHQSFIDGRNFLKRFKIPFYSLMGNHDLEGKDFDSDSESVKDWCEVFDCKEPYTQVEVSGHVLIFLSSTSYRNNPNSCHEVYVDDNQYRWFCDVLKKNSSKKIIVFSHCPIFGSGLKILQNLHLRVPNAYVNHSRDPEKFIELVHQYPNIVLWFSGHNHLGQNYKDSVSTVKNCAFVHTGVMGNITRDGNKHSRVLNLYEDKFEVCTLDHSANQCFVDFEKKYGDDVIRRHLTGFQQDSEKFYSPPSFTGSHEKIKFGKSVFIFHRDMLVEFDAHWQTPRGVVADNITGAGLQIKEDKLYLKTKEGKLKVLKADKNGFYSRVFFRNPYLKSSRTKGS